MKVLVLYASTHGHTAKIASRIVETLTKAGGKVHLSSATSAGELAPADFDAVVVGASVHAGHFQREVVEWVTRHATALNAMPSAFFSVSLIAAEDTDEAHATTLAYLDGLLEETGWEPALARSFAGALQYLEYDFATRLVMRLLMKHRNHPTDVTRDFDYTDWDDVDAFARECAAMASGVAA
jgi:menaquinone-dependent protoporphyrinogen oxidase